MKKILIIDDDRSTRNLFRLRLSADYEIFDTDDPEQAVALALEHKPDAILLDLMMPRFSGFELCRSLQALSYTSSVPLFVISGHSGAQFREQCANVGASGYFEKPVNFDALKRTLAAELGKTRREARTNAHIALRVALKLRAITPDGKAFEEVAETEQVSARGFLCSCAGVLIPGSLVEVFMAGATKRAVGNARVLRKESPGPTGQRYACEFEGEPKNWVLQAASTQTDVSVRAASAAK